MKYSTKKVRSRAFLIYAAINIFAYFFAHVAYLFANDVAGEIFEYVSYYLSKTVEFLAPPIIAAIAYTLMRERGRGAMVGFAFSTASARLFYSIPYYYIIFIYNYGYDSIESITLSLLASVLVIIVTVLGVIISLSVCHMLMKKRCKREEIELDEAIDNTRRKTEVFDFLSLGNLPVLVFALLRFAFSFVCELFDTVTFFIEYRSDYLPKEIITILANFTLLFVLLVASYLLAATFKNSLVDKLANNSEEEEES